MALKEQISSDMKAALLGGHRFEGDTLRGLKAAILNEEVAQNKRDTGISDPEIEQIVAREIKKRNESAKIYRDNDRVDLAEPEEREAEILFVYLPTQMSEADVRALVEKKIAAMGVSGHQAMGQVIGVVKQEVGNTADGALIARLAKESLAN